MPRTTWYQACCRITLPRARNGSACTQFTMIAFGCSEPSSAGIPPVLELQISGQTPALASTSRMTSAVTRCGSSEVYLSVFVSVSPVVMLMVESSTLLTVPDTGEGSPSLPPTASASASGSPKVTAWPAAMRGRY